MSFNPNTINQKGLSVQGSKQLVTKVVKNLLSVTSSLKIMLCHIGLSVFKTIADPEMHNLLSEQVTKITVPTQIVWGENDQVRQTACLIINPIIVDGFASLFNCVVQLLVFIYSGTQ